MAWWTRIFSLGVLLPWFFGASALAGVNVSFSEAKAGSGIQYGLGDRMEILLRISLGGVTVREEQGSMWVIARIGGDLGFSRSDTGERGVPSNVDIEFVGLAHKRSPGLKGLTYRFAPGAWGTNFNLNQRTLRVDAIGVETNYLGEAPILDNAMWFAKLAADAVGYKLVTRFNDDPVFKGANVGAVSAAIGLILAVGEGFMVSVELGGRADLSVKGSFADGFDVRSDMGAYNEVTLDVHRVVRLFVRNESNFALESEVEDQREWWRVLAGATFVF